MDSTDLSKIPSVRLASGVEMQQRWLHHQQQSQKPTDGEAPRLIELAPKRGSQGTVVTVVMQPLTHQLVPVKLAFHDLVVDTKHMQSQGIISLVAKVPPFQHTHSATANVPISICMMYKDSVIEAWPVAEFVYEFDTKDSASISTASSASLNTASDYGDEKISAFQQKEQDFSGGPYNHLYQQPDNSYNQCNNYHDTKYNRRNRQSTNYTTSNPNHHHHYHPLSLLASNSTGYTGILTEFDQNESVLPSPLPPQAALGYSHHMSASAATDVTPQSHSTTTTATATAPAYGGGKSSVHVPSMSVANYHPYPALASRADLKIMGDLDSMAKNWATDEWDHRRRLVQFWREQTGNEIRCTFGPVAQGERMTGNDGHIVVSCIYWAEHNDCFITSVDCIHLLESLMDIRFSVEEKNRVRRNLEGFRPLTVSKCKPESADFFKLIMSFPNPKPRNIEKDIKVFPWKTLPYALKKIVTKYTASSCNISNNSGTQQQRRAQHKSTNVIPTRSVTMQPASSCMNSKQQVNGMNSFYPSQSNIYQPPSFVYQTQPQPQPQPLQEALSSLYQSSPPTSVPAFSSSSYSESSPVLDAKDSPSPRLQNHYNALLNSNNTHSIDDLDAASKFIPPPSHQKLSPSNRRTSLDNQHDYLVNFEKD